MMIYGKLNIQPNERMLNLFKKKELKVLKESITAAYESQIILNRMKFTKRKNNSDDNSIFRYYEYKGVHSTDITNFNFILFYFIHGDRGVIITVTIKYKLS